MECLIFGGACVLFLVFFRPIMAVLTIIFGDKEGLKEFGNLCNEPLPPNSYSWREENRAERERAYREYWTRKDEWVG